MLNPEITGTSIEEMEANLVIPPRSQVRDRFLLNTEGAPLVVDDVAVNRIDKHERYKRSVAAELRAHGMGVVEAEGASSFDLFVNDHVRVALRVAYPGMRRHRVTAGGRTYRYRYETWHFNFHHHGRLDERYTDFFVCIAKDCGGANKDHTFVIPWASVSGKTFSLHGGRGAYRGRYAPFLGAWGALRRASVSSCNDVRHGVASDLSAENFWLGSAVSAGLT